MSSREKVPIWKQQACHNAQADIMGQTAWLYHLQSARDSVRTEKDRKIRRKKRVEALVAEKRQLLMNLLRERQPVEILQSRRDVLPFPQA